MNITWQFMFIYKCKLGIINFNSQFVGTLAGW